MRRIALRCIPVLLVAYIVAYVDRVNVGFAAITASKDLGMSPAVFGFGAGLFFLAYLIFEVPSNWLMERVGARRWLARIMVSCGLVACAMVFVSGPVSFYAMRFLLGAVEAGLFPGVMLYLTYWFPQHYRARYIGMFAVGIPLASVLGAPISGLLLNLDGLFGLQGWQWLYVLEGVPGIALGVLIWVFLTDRPREAAWLAPQEREWLERTLERERAAHRDRTRHLGLLRSLSLLADRRVIVLAAVFFGTGMPSYGLAIWLPQIVHGFGLSNAMTGLVSAVPFLFGAAGMVLWAARSDRARERIWHTVVMAFVAAAGMAACVVVRAPLPTMIALSVSALGVFALKGPLLSAISESFSSGTAAVGIAMVVSIGNLSGLAAPALIGVIKQATGVFPPALLMLGLSSLAGGLCMLLLSRRPRSAGTPSDRTPARMP
jgi:ACS family tartrate transporter-like MFS transporter